MSATIGQEPSRGVQVSTPWRFLRGLDLIFCFSLRTRAVPMPWQNGLVILLFRTGEFRSCQVQDRISCHVTLGSDCLQRRGICKGVYKVIEQDTWQVESGKWSGLILVTIVNDTFAPSKSENAFSTRRQIHPDSGSCTSYSLPKPRVIYFQNFNA